MIILFLVFSLNLILNLNNQYISFENLRNDFSFIGFEASVNWLLYATSITYSLALFSLIYIFNKKNKESNNLISLYNYATYFGANLIAVTFTIFLFRITNYSRFLYLVYLILLPAIILLIKSVQKSSLKISIYILSGIFLLYSVLLTESTINGSNNNLSNDELQNYSTLEDQYCNIFENNTILNDEDIENIISVVGHAYGKPGGENIGLSENLLNYFLKQEIYDNEIAIFNGDFNRNNTIEDLEQAKIQIEKHFDNYYLVPGNHEVRENNNFYKVFKKDFFNIELQNTLLIGANFNNSDWLPSVYQKNLINEIINESTSETIILFSHQLFWKDLFPNDISPNSNQFLKKLDPSPVDWIVTNEKKLIIISGDYGAFGAYTFCKNYGNITFIANGIGGLETDTIIKIFETKNGLVFKEINLK
jgi:hypothetical protein